MVNITLWKVVWEAKVAHLRGGNSVWRPYVAIPELLDAMVMTVAQKLAVVSYFDVSSVKYLSHEPTQAVHC